MSTGCLFLRVFQGKCLLNVEFQSFLTNFSTYINATCTRTHTYTQLAQICMQAEGINTHSRALTLNRTQAHPTPCLGAIGI